MVRRAVVAVWSVLAFLLLSKTAFAYPDPLVKSLILEQRDSNTLMGRMKFPAKQESFQNSPLLTKRFQTSDGAIRFDCGQHQNPQQNYAIVCAVTLDLAKSTAGISQISRGYVEKSYVFKVLAKNDVAAMLANMVYTAGPFYTSETINVNTDQAQDRAVPRFYYNCPRDWVFDVVACEGHIIVR